MRDNVSPANVTFNVAPLVVTDSRTRRSRERVGDRRARLRSARGVEQGHERRVQLVEADAPSENLPLKLPDCELECLLLSLAERPASNDDELLLA